MEGRDLQELESKPIPNKTFSFSSHFSWHCFPQTSPHSHPQVATAASGTVVKPQQVFAWLGAKSRCPLGGDQHCSHPALLLREGKQSSTGHGRELGPASGCESQHWDAWAPLLPEVPQGHSTLTVSSCPCSAAESRDRHCSFCQVSAVSLSLCWMSH